MWTSEDLFRLALLAILVLTMSVAIYYRRLAAASGETISHREEGYLFALGLRLCGVAMWISTFTFLLNPASIQWAELPFPDWFRWTGVLAGLLCIGMIHWTLSNLGRNLTDTVVTRKDAFLVTSGPYQWVRHPFYVSTALLMFAVTILSASLIIGVCCLVTLIMLAIRTPKEEQKLIEKFGDQYRDYMSRTGRFIPRLFPRPK